MDEALLESLRKIIDLKRSEKEELKLTEEFVTILRSIVNKVAKGELHLDMREEQEIKSILEEIERDVNVAKMKLGNLGHRLLASSRRG